MVVLALRQTHGRGTGGKRWVSDAPMGVWCTVVLMGEMPHPISLVVGVAAVDAIRSLGCDAHVKWPNDVLIGRKKVAGILVETASAPGSRGPAYLVGIGINVMQESFDGELAGRATSLRMEMKDPPPTIAAVFGALVRSIEDHLSSEEPVARRWIARTRMIDTEAEIVRGGRTERVMVRGLTLEGRLVVEREDRHRDSIAAASDMDLTWPMG
jgi:BirA family biotin operon repressor/biotin-[acetyl-CoA-carboxylase] ligase